MSPAHASRAAVRSGPEHRWPVLIVVAAVIVGTAVGLSAQGSPSPASAPATPAALVSAPDAESSAWYCTSQTTPSGPASGFLVLSNTTTRAVTADVTTVTDTGATVSAAVPVPAQSVLAPSLPVPSSGSWQAETVTLDGGGVAVSEAVHGPAGWSVVPCQSSTSAGWYFASGSTAGSNTLYVSLLNPTSSPVVVDLGFMTPTGAVHPVNYQGVVIDPGATLAEDVASEVQNASLVSTVVTARTGRVVASEVQTYAGASAGLSVLQGTNQPEDHWAIPLAQETPGGGDSEIDVFNPGTVPEKVTVHLRLASGPLAPLADTVAPGGTWALVTSRQTRIPAGASYSAQVDATGGPGVVVSRAVVAPASATAPQAGVAVAVDGLTSATPANEWIVPPPGTQASPAVSGVGHDALTMLNVGDARATFRAYAVAPGTRRLLASGSLAPGGSYIVSGSTLVNAGFDAIVVHGDGPMAVSEDFTPSGGVGVVGMPGIALAAPLGF
ncbi:MAG TPA: DUF5719 family protein [Acidimicrobiales bacterium]|nr:DUF5719 family protein [Acidimicrobiales bacterium]